MTCLNEPDNREKQLEELLNATEVLVDEFGNTHELVRAGEFALPLALFNHPERRIPRSVKDVVIKADDVFLATYPKTGMISFWVFLIPMKPKQSIKRICFMKYTRWLLTVYQQCHCLSNLFCTYRNTLGE